MKWRSNAGRGSKDVSLAKNKFRKTLLVYQ
jgi:hypothetical protein